MTALLASFEGLPRWLIFAIVGGIFGAAGAVIGWALERVTGFKQARYITILAIALSPLATREFVFPRIVEAITNRDLPKQVDEVTTLVSFEIHGKFYAYNYELAPSVDPATDVEAIKKAGLPDLCAYWLPQFKNGEVYDVEYRYRLPGRVSSFHMRPNDC